MNFKLEKFEGPLAVLLELIEKQELDITEISLAKIADQYIDHIKNWPRLPPEEMADFLVVAAKLLLIKSKALLPFLGREEEEEIHELAEQLKMYREFLQAAEKIQDILGRRRFSFAREFNRRAILQSSRLFSPPKNLTANELARAFKEIIKNIRPAEKLAEKNLEPVINIEEKILAIERLLLDKLKASFNHILAAAQNKTEIIVSFLALLELVKQKNIAAAQVEMFGEIEVSKIM